MLAAAGVPLATAQVLMRHSTPTLTARHYVDPAMLDTAGAVEKLPCGLPDGVEITAAEAVENGPEKCPLKCPPSNVKGRHNLSISGAHESIYARSTEGQAHISKGPKTGPIVGGGCQGRTEKDGSGAGTRTPDTWIMISARDITEIKKKKKAIKDLT